MFKLNVNVKSYKVAMKSSKIQKCWLLKAERAFQGSVTVMTLLKKNVEKAMLYPKDALFYRYLKIG